MFYGPIVSASELFGDPDGKSFPFLVWCPPVRKTCSSYTVGNKNSYLTAGLGCRRSETSLRACVTNRVFEQQFCALTPPKTAHPLCSLEKPTNCDQESVKERKIIKNCYRTSYFNFHTISPAILVQQNVTFVFRTCVFNVSC